MSEDKKTLNDLLDVYDQEFNNKLNELSEEAKEDLSFGVLDYEGTQSHIIKQVADLHKWSEKQARHKQSVKRAYNATNRIYGKLYEQCRRDMLDIAMRGKSEIDSWICRQAQYAKAKSYLNDLECQLEFIEKTLEAIKSKGFAIKNIMENRKFFEGG